MDFMVADDPHRSRFGTGAERVNVRLVRAGNAEDGGTVGLCWLMLVSGSLLTGCQRLNRRSRVSQSPSFPGISLKVGAMDDVAILAGVAPQRGEWEASRQGDVVIRDEPLTLESLSERRRRALPRPATG